MLQNEMNGTEMKVPYGANVLITGASSGLGKSCAELFASSGYHIWGVSRNCEETDVVFQTGMIHMRKMDVTDDISVMNTVNRIISEAGQIGIVIHCAGFGIGGSVEDVPLDLAKQQMETNYFGVLRVNRQLLPHLRRQNQSLILVMSSVAGFISIPFQSHYSSSKYALEAYVEALRMECKPFGIRAALIEPGDTKTGFTAARNTYVCEDSVYEETCRHAVGKMEKDEQNGKEPISAAKVALKLARKKRLPIRKVVGFDYQMLALLKKLLPSRMVEAVLTDMYLNLKNKGK